MQACNCAMSVAFEMLSRYENYDLLISAKSHLKSAILQAEEYRKVRDGVYWQSADTQLKRRTKEKLNRLAFNTYTELLTATKNLDKYAEAKTLEGIAPPQEWGEIILHLNCAFNWIEREHGREIKSLQLSLFKG